ncbi:MAG: hypothetical protein V7711_10310 [Pseudomonadales bacterium]
MISYKKLSTSIPAGLLIFMSTSSYADNLWENGLDIRLGAMWTDSSTIVHLNGEDIGGDIGIEDDLNMEENAITGRLGLGWRFKDRHQITFDLYTLHRDGRSNATGDFNFYTDEDEFVEVEGGAQVDTTLNFDIADVSYRYSIIQNSKHHLSASVGLYWMDIQFSIEASGKGKITIDGELLEGDGVIQESATVGAPMPLIGAQYNYAITPQWTLDLNARYFGITVDPYSGSISNFNVTTTYFFDKVYLGGGITWVDVDVDIEDDDWRGGIEWKFTGPHIFVGTRF